jgi:hypothetical protein
MGILKPVLILAILSSALLCSNAWAVDPPPRVGAVPDEARPAVKPDAKAPRKPVKRRAVRQILDDDKVRIPSPPAFIPNPVAPGAYQPMPSAVPPPAVLNGCNGGACTDANGQRYHGGVGTTLLSPQGRVCSNNGITVQCF